MQMSMGKSQTPELLWAESSEQAYILHLLYLLRIIPLLIFIFQMCNQRSSLRQKQIFDKQIKQQNKLVTFIKMIQFLSQLNLSSIRCTDHFETSNMICLDKQCETRGLICPICESRDHKEHIVKPFKYFLNQLIPQYQSTKIALIMADIDLVVQKIKAEFKKIANKEDTQELQKSFATYVNQLYEKINAQMRIEADIREFFESKGNLTMQRINKFVNQYELHDYELSTNESKEVIKLTNFEKLLYQILEELNEKHNDYLDLVKSRAEIKDILGIFIFSQTKEKFNFVFSEQFKHPDIKITDQIHAKQAHNYSSNFALIEPMIIGKKKSMSKKTVKIKIDKLNSWINLGVCVKSKVVASSYYFSTDDIGHGAYTISNDGYSWHNVESGTNSHYHGWSFTTGDVISMTYDPKSKSIKYTKENDDKEHQVSCEPIPGEEMYFCVTLNTHDEAVSIVP